MVLLNYFEIPPCHHFPPYSILTGWLTFELEGYSVLINGFELRVWQTFDKGHIFMISFSWKFYQFYRHFEFETKINDYKTYSRFDNTIFNLITQSLYWNIKHNYLFPYLSLEIVMLWKIMLTRPHRLPWHPQPQQRHLVVEARTPTPRPQLESWTRMSWHLKSTLLCWKSFLDLTIGHDRMSSYPAMKFCSAWKLHPTMSKTTRYVLELATWALFQFTFRVWEEITKMIRQPPLKFIYSEKATNFLRNLHLFFDWY